MKCCIECFKDSEIRTAIKSYKKEGNCGFCGGKNVFVCDSDDVSNPLLDLLTGFLDIYSLSDLEEAKLLKHSLEEDWDIFRVGADAIQMIIQEFSWFDRSAEILNEKVIISKKYDADYLDKYCIVRGYSWQTFATSIKYGNRFHSNIFCADAFIYFLDGISKTYPSETHFFRARIAENIGGFSTGEMGMPPPDKRSAGRVNPEGIGILYLSSDDETVFNEIRASTFDYVTIGTFELLKDIRVVNLSGISKTSPFSFQGEVEKYAVNREVFPEIALEIAKPLRRGDSPLEYLPTQYIAEFIKSQGYDGVEFTSTLRDGGNNIAAFNESLFKCVDVKTIEITKIMYEIR